jgi:hypothetical protein
MFTIVRWMMTPSAYPEVRGYKLTLEDALSTAEIEIAQLRGDLAKKHYFSYAIIDMKTGKLVGSVIEAPPAIDWTTAGK